MQAEKLKDGKRKHFLGNSLTIKTKTEMKKNLFMVAAVALFAAVSCNDQLSQDVTPAGETVTFEASVDGADTKVSLEGKVSKWENGDKITIHNGTKGYEFSTTDAGTKATFSYTGADFAGEKFMAVYPSGNYTADVEARTVTGVVIPDKQVLKAGTFPSDAAVSVAYSENESLNFKNAVAVLKFKVTGDDVKYGAFYADGGKGDLTGKYNLAYNNGEPVLTSVEAMQWVDFHMNDAVLSKDATYYLAVAPAAFATGFGISLNGVEVKKHAGAFTLERNHIYDLGTLEYKVVDPSTLSWSICGDMNNWTGDIAMTLEGDWFVAKEVEVSAGQAFKFRANSSWDVNRGIPGDAEPVTLNPDEEKTVEHNGKNMTVAAGTYNIYLSKDCTKVKVEAVGGSETPDVTPGETSEWALVGAFSGWADKYFVTTETANVVVYKNVALKAAEGFLVRKPSTDWNDKYGAGNVNYLKPNHYIVTSKNGADMCLEADGTYDIYFDASSKKIYIMEAGKDYTTASEQTVNGEEPKQEEPEVTEKQLYLKPNANWKQSNARFAAYFFSNDVVKWVSMTDSDKDGIYEVYIPEGFDYGCSVIFCRMNPATSANNWNNKWNQTADLKAPTDGKNLYTVKDGTWDKGGGTWSVK